ncbi:hypothetical protein BCR36DRAFT_319691 [Piromyces finnis]|uniref:BZIP domain-containing protein n=1 Tax=Piromyces finnis TaxID=1754191 RepID=A0A1Y1VIV6_9FUNG|nr:hypothetical protein BCR36DRAFT_319691 [Piromyces finnis]|eukprot:ORX57336.1 hypothetical protein BCR36DRAFT_319691 [Piromyces finnis]
MAESMNSDDILSYINEELITNNNSKNELSDDIFTNYIKSENNKNVNSTINMTEKNKIALAQASIYNSITNNVYSSTLPLSPPQDDINSPNGDIYLNSQNIPSNSINLSNSSSIELEALSPSSIGSDGNDIKNDEPSLLNLTQIYQNNGLLVSDGIMNPSLMSLSNHQEYIDDNTMLNSMCSEEREKSPLFPQILPDSNITIPTTNYINDALNPLSTVNISLPTSNNIPVSLNTNITLPTVTVPTNALEYTVPSNALNLNNAMATTAALNINSLQSLTPLSMNESLTISNVNTVGMNPSVIINSTSAPALATVKTENEDNTTSSVVSTNVNTNSVTSTNTTTTKPPLSATLDLSSIKSSVNETLELTKKLSQVNGSTLKKGNSIDVTDILKSDVAASCLNLLKGSKGKPGRKKKCIQSPSDDNNSNTLTSTTSSNNNKTFPLLNTVNANNDKNTNNVIGNKFPIIKPKSSSADNHTPLLPLAPITTKSNSINCFNNTTSKTINSTIIHPTPILPNGSTEKNNTNSTNGANTVKTAYQKRQERLLKNREAAHLSRKRKREQLHMLETHAQELIAENQTLKLKVIELEQLNEKLVKENKLLKMNMGINDVSIKKEPDEPMMTDIPEINTTTEMPNDIYNLYIKSEVLTPTSTVSSSSSTDQNNSSTKSKEIGIVFMILIFSFSLFTFPLSIFTNNNSNEVSKNLISSFMNKLSDFSLASISPDNTGKILSSSYEQEKPYLLDSGHYELADTPVQSGELEISDRRRSNINYLRKERGQLSQYKKSRKLKNGSQTKPKHKRNTTLKSIKKNYEYTSFNEISSLMSIFHPKNVDLDEESLKQLSLLQHWIVEGFCSIHENHTYAKDPSNVKDIIKVYNAEDKNEKSSTDLTIKKNNNNYYYSQKSYSKEIPYNMKQFIKFYPDTTYFYSPKLVQLFPLSTNDILEPSIPIFNRLQSNDTTSTEEIAAHENNKTITPSSNYKKGVEENKEHSTRSESQENDNVYHLPFTKKPKMAIITNLESDDIDEESNSYLMIDFEIKGARLIENE